MRGRAFKEKYRLAPLRSGTPPPPREFIEPLSPVLSSGAAPFSSAGGYDQTRQQQSNGINGALEQTQGYGHAERHRPHHSGVSVSKGVSLPFVPVQQSNPQLSPVLRSPIDALANAAVSASPVYVDPTRPASQDPTSPATAVAFFQANDASLKHPHPDDSSIYMSSEPPSKRARSDFFPSPHSRPATSHIPSHDWFYTAEQVVGNGAARPQEPPLPWDVPEDSSKRLLDAELLLFLRHSGSERSQSHSQFAQSAPAKRWSIAHPNLTAPDTAYTRESLGPYMGTSFANDNSTRPMFGYAGLPKPEAAEQRPAEPTLNTSAPSAVQTHTPPEDSYMSLAPVAIDNEEEVKKPKKHQGWPKGKPRGPRAGGSSSKKRKPASKPKVAVPVADAGNSEQLHSPESLPTDTRVTQLEILPDAPPLTVHLPNPAPSTRRYSLSNVAISNIEGTGSLQIPAASIRSRSVPPDNSMVIVSTPTGPDMGALQSAEATESITVCAGCNSQSSLSQVEDSQQWINCDGCKGWFHFGCAGFETEREVRDVDKFYCDACSPKFGKTTKVRKSGRPHTAVDYAGLNEGILKTSGDNPEHHYIASFKNGDIQFTPDSFARVSPELVTADFFEKANGFLEPVLVPGYLNPRPRVPGLGKIDSDPVEDGSTEETLDYLGMYERVRDDGQDKMDMVIPEGLTVRRVAQLYGLTEKVDVIDVKSQEGDKRWTMAKWADYYEQKGEKPVRNVISLEVSDSKLGRIIRRPKAVRDMDLQDSVWPEDDKRNAPKVQFYCLMSVADCYTDFHIDFGGSSVYYHIIRGKKTFFFIPPNKQNLKKYEDWCLSPNQSQEFLGQQVKECIRVDLSAGDTMLIPSGWIHAVWTPEDSLVIGGNFLTRIHYGMQIKVAEIEKNTKVARKFRYPFFQKVMWFVVLKYLEEDPLPPSVVQVLVAGEQFKRETPIYCQPDRFGPNSFPGPENYNARYYSKAELDGLPDLLGFIWRTVMVSLGRIEGLTAQTRNAVAKSIPKGKGDPLTIARQFAMWAAWKRGNENLPQWAHPDTVLPEVPDAKAEKKPSAAQIKRMEREALNESLRERHSLRTKPEPVEPPVQPDQAQLVVSAPETSTEAAKHLSTPKTSQLGPKRIACDACRKRRIRCKHKDELVESGRSLNVPSSPLSKPEPSGTITVDGTPILPDRTVMRIQVEADPKIGTHPAASDPPLLANGADTGDVQSKPGRVKACADCRKSKRRCIHDENGNVDPVKASEAPIPRGSASKKRRVSEGEIELSTRKLKSEQTPKTDGLGHEGIDRSLFPEDPSPTNRPLHRQALDVEMHDSIAVVALPRPREQSPSDDIMLVDNSIMSMVTDPDQVPGTPPSVAGGQDQIISSIEDHLEPDGCNIHEEGAVIVVAGDVQPSIRPAQTPRSAYRAGSIIYAGQSSPLSDPARSVSPDADQILNTPMVDAQRRSARAAKAASSARKPSQTPRPVARLSATPKSAKMDKSRRDSKSIVKAERKSLALPVTEGDDEASLKLALQLQMEEHGLRRRSK